LDIQIAAPPLQSKSEEDHQLATADLPSNEVFQAIGRAIVLAAQIELDELSRVISRLLPKSIKAFRSNKKP
jgi:hypothetical protein